MTNTEDTPGNTNKPTQPAGKPTSGIDKKSHSAVPSKDKQGRDKTGDEATRPTEHGGSKGLEPTRYGDWEHNSRCTDF